MINKDSAMSPVHHLRVSGLIEGISYLLLLGIAMPLKYYAGLPEAVRYVGMVHGILFIWYIASIIWTKFSVKMSVSHALVAFVASLVPFGTFYADNKIFKHLHQKG